MKKFLIGVFLILIIGFFMDLDRQVVVAPHVKHYIQEIGNNYTNEVLTCLEYTEVGPIIFVYSYELSYHKSSYPGSVYADKCNVGQMPIHNHPSRNFHASLKKYYTTYTGDSLESRKQMVYMSYSDVKILFKDRYKYAAVSAGDYMAWYTNEQIKQALIEKKKLLKPKKDQTLWID